MTPARRRRLDLGPRPRRRQGPADPVGAGDRRRRRRPGRLLHRAGGGVARAALRRGDQRSSGPGVAGPHRVVARAGDRRPRAGDGVLPLRRRGRGVRRGHADQPVPRHLLRDPVGRPGAGVAAARAGVPRRSARHARSACCSRRSPASPRARACTSTPPGSATGPPRPGCSPSSGSSWSTPTPPTSGPVRLWCAAYLGDHAHRIGALLGTTFLARADPFEVYSSLVAKLSIWGRARRRARRCAARSPTSTPWSRGPGWSRWSACCSAAPRSTPSRSRRPGCKLVQSTSSVTACRARHPRADRLLASASALVLHRRAPWRPASSGDLPRRTLPQPVRALGGPDHRRLHRRPLPDLPRRVRPADADPAQRPVQHGATTTSAPPTCRSTTGCSCHPTFLAVSKVARRRRSATWSAWSRPTTGRSSCCRERHQLTGQLPLLVAMVCFTVGGLYLLFAA